MPSEDLPFLVEKIEGEGEEDSGRGCGIGCLGWFGGMEEDRVHEVSVIVDVEIMLDTEASSSKED